MSLFKIVSLFFFTCLLMHAKSPTDYQVTVKSDPNPQVNFFLQPVFTQGVSQYLQTTFNDPLYVLEILPHSFAHVIELLQHGRDTKKPKIYFKSVLRLFADEYKRTCVNAYAFGDFLVHLPSLLKEQFIIDASKAFESLKDMVNEMLLSTFVAKFPEFKANPGTFLESVSQDIEDAVELRKLVQLFLEVTLSKLVWNPDDKEKTWENVKKIGQSLQTLYKNQMIANQDDLNSLYLTLVERYCFFLDLTQKQLIQTPSFYQKIRDDIASRSISFLELAEQEQYLETKSQRILRVVHRAQEEIYREQVKMRARQEGIVI